MRCPPWGDELRLTDATPVPCGNSRETAKRSELERFVADIGSVLLARPDRTNEKRRFGVLAGMRQWIEAIYDTCQDQLNREGHGGRTPDGVFIRVAQRLLALTAAI